MVRRTRVLMGDTRERQVTTTPSASALQTSPTPKKQLNLDVVRLYKQNDLLDNCIHGVQSPKKRENSHFLFLSLQNVPQTQPRSARRLTNRSVATICVDRRRKQ